MQYYYYRLYLQLHLLIFIFNVSRECTEHSTNFITYHNSYTSIVNRSENFNLAKTTELSRLTILQEMKKSMQ